MYIGASSEEWIICGWDYGFSETACHVCSGTKLMCTERTASTLSYQAISPTLSRIVFKISSAVKNNDLKV